MDSLASLRRDLLIAALLALVLGLGWTWAAWADLRALRLPDTDDLMRLQQVRDWLAGQAFVDVGQHRVAGGVPLHWSRLPDLPIAALIGTLTPLLGQHGAEVAAVVIWPLALFAAALCLVTRIARAVGTEPATATVIAALAWPATTVFLPGRIDHHGLQMVLLLAATLAQLRPPSAGAGIVAGLLAAASLVIGLETMPLFAVLGLAAAAEWIAARPGAAQRCGGLGIGALVGLAAGKGLFATTGWDFPACDGFTAQAWRAALPLAAVPLVLAALDARVAGWRARAGVAAVAGALAATVALAVSPACVAPYGGVDPIAARVWLARVGEAQGLFQAPAATAIAYAGLLLVGLGAGLWQVRRERSREWATLAALLIASLLLTIATLRGVYAGALLAAPALAAAVAAERVRAAWRLSVAWAVSAGLLWPLAAQALAPAAPMARTGRGDCTAPAMLRALDTLPPGTVMAPVDAGAAILAGTRHRVIAAPYHRGGVGIAASWRFYAGDSAAASGATYALICAGMPAPGRLPPGWRPIRQLPDGATVNADARLSDRPSRR